MADDPTDQHPKSTNESDAQPATEDFAEQAEQADVGLVQEFIDFLKYNKAWWLTPIIVVLLLVGVLIMVGGTAWAPFIYTLF